MQKQRDIAPLVKAVATVIREHVSKAFRALVERLDGVEAKIAALPVPKDGRNAFEVAVSLGYEGSVHDWLQSLEGKAGKSVTLDDIRPLIADAVKEIPIPEDGKSVTLDEISPLISEAVAQLPRPKDGTSVTAEEIIPLVMPSLESKAREIARQAVAELPKPKDGESVTLDDIRPIVHQAFDAIPRPKDGTSVTVDEVRPIIDDFLKSIPLPQNGKSVTVDDVLPHFHQAFDRWALDFERRAQDIHTRLLSTFEKPKDGTDGEDGLGFDDMRVEHDGERAFTFIHERGERRKEFTFTVPVVLERGVYKADRSYERGDAVTADGSYWIAQKDGPSGKPGQSPDWRLAVKKGRDGKGS